MKKVINGKVYDTEKAVLIAEWSNGRYNDIEYVEEALYRKRTGEFFIFGSGGAASRYAESRPIDGWTGGAKILPISWESARKWAEDHASVEKYEEVFGEVAEDDSKTVVTMSMSVGALERAKRAAAQSGMSLSAYIESLIQ